MSAIDKVVNEAVSTFHKVVDAVTPGASEEKTDAIELLKQDHDEVDALFKEYEHLAENGGSSSERRELSTRICGLIAVHAMIEEEIFYPAARKAGVEADLLDEATIEHGSAKDLIAQIGAAQASKPLYDARVKVLGEYIRHHVKEEEGELFPACRKADMNVEMLGERMRQRKAELLAKLNGE